MKNAQSIFLCVMTGIWMAVVAWAIWPIDPPLQYLPGDSVTPDPVKEGGVITVHRKIHVTRKEPVVVVRNLIKGNCSPECEIVDLPSSSITVIPDAPRIQTRDFVLPSTVEAGTWRLAFRYNWTDRIGRVHSEPIPEIIFTVIK
jgi:hypothetical protein